MEPRPSGRSGGNELAGEPEGVLPIIPRDPRGRGTSCSANWLGPVPEPGRRKAEGIRMLIKTSRFGALDIEADDILLFPQGLMGFEECRHWVLLADAENEAVGWLQNISRPELAFAVVSPRRFVPGYEVRVPRGQLAPLQLTEVDQAYILTVVGKNETGLTVNLKAPLIINLDRRLGRQIVTCDDQPMQHVLGPSSAIPLRKSA